MKMTYVFKDLDLEGTAEELFIQARNNYIEEPKALEKIIEILKQENMTDKAEYVRFIKEAIEAPEHPVKIGQIKRDYADYKGTKGSETITWYEKYDRKVDVSCIFELGNVIVSLEAYLEGKYATGSASFPWNRFKDFSQKEFESALNSIYYHNLELVEVA